MPDANVNSPFPFSQHFGTDKNNVAPRLGLAYGFGAKDRTVIRASTGLFYDPPQTDQYRRAILNNGSPAFFTLTAIPGVAYAPAFPNVLPSAPTGFNAPAGDITTVSPDFATLYSCNANVSISQEIGGGFVATASYLYTKGTHLPVYRNINLVPSGAFLADGTADLQQHRAGLPRLHQHTLRGIGRELGLQRTERLAGEALLPTAMSFLRRTPGRTPSTMRPNRTTSTAAIPLRCPIRPTGAGIAATP